MVWWLVDSGPIAGWWIFGMFAAFLMAFIYFYILQEKWILIISNNFIIFFLIFFIKNRTRKCSFMLFNKLWLKVKKQIIWDANKLTLHKFNYCPYCGKKIQGLNISQLNYCCFCGIKLRKNYKSSKMKTQCTICHEYIGQKKNNTIKCSYCDSQYHPACITSWLLKYNSCPMCLNVFLMPKSISTSTRNI